MTEDRAFNGFGTNFEGSPEPIYGSVFLPRKFKARGLSAVVLHTRRPYPSRMQDATRRGTPHHLERAPSMLVRRARADISDVSRPGESRCQTVGVP